MRFRSILTLCIFGPAAVFALKYPLLGSLGLASRSGNHDVRCRSPELMSTDRKRPPLVTEQVRKSLGAYALCRFESGRPHQRLKPARR
jgi:hypothetical protein